MRESITQRRESSTPLNLEKQVKKVLKSPGAAKTYSPSYDYSLATQVGVMSNICPKCSGKKWDGESEGMCCSDGKVQLQLLSEPAEPLKHLLIGESSESRNFLENIIRYNSCFQMTSFGADKQVNEGGFMQTFKVQGQVYHRVGLTLREILLAGKHYLQFIFVFIMPMSSLSTVYCVMCLDKLVHCNINTNEGLFHNW